MPQKARGQDCLDFYMVKVLIGLFPRVFFFFFSSYRNYLRRGPVGLGQSPPCLRAGWRGTGRVAFAGPRPAPLGCSDFASKGERCDTYVCKEGPSVSGSCQGPVFRDPCSVGEGVFPHPPSLLGLGLNTVFSLVPQCSWPFSGPCGPCEYAGGTSP